MVSGIENTNISSLQYLKATQAFKAAGRKNNEVQEPQIQDIEDRVSISSANINTTGKVQDKFSLLKPEKMNELKNIANSIQSEISDDDIKYGLMYGRSILVNYSA